jgi:hypothetical protein
MTRFGIDAPTLLHLVVEDVVVSPEHRLVTPQTLRSQALALSVDPAARARADGVVPLGSVDQLSRQLAHRFAVFCRWSNVWSNT